MFNWFKKKVPEKAVESEVKREPKYKDCDIEFLPVSGLYFPRYKGKYIYLWTYGKFELVDRLGLAKSFYEEKDAKEFLDRYLETRGWGTKIIKIEE